MILRMILALTYTPALLLCSSAVPYTKGKCHCGWIYFENDFSFVAILLKYHRDQSQPWVLLYCILKNVLQWTELWVTIWEGFCLLKHEKVKEKFMMEEKSPFLIATEESATPAWHPVSTIWELFTFASLSFSASQIIQWLWSLTLVMILTNKSISYPCSNMFNRHLLFGQGFGFVCHIASVASIASVFWQIDVVFCVISRRRGAKSSSFQNAWECNYS